MHENMTLQEINDEQARVLIPAMVVVVVLMIIGLTGNPLVVYFYGYKLKPTASYMFIVAVACFDLITCAISMPLEIVDLVHFYTFPSSEACSIVRFVNYFASFSSGSTLVAIAVDRFRRICRPFSKQISIKLARIIILLIVGTCFILAVPAFVFYKVVEVNVTKDLHVIGYDCTTIRNEEYVLYITLYNIFCFILFVATITVLIVLYSLVGNQLFKLKRRQSYTKNKTNACSSFEEFSSTSPTKDDSQHTVLPRKKTTFDRAYSSDTIRETISDNDHSNRLGKSGVHFQTDQTNNKIKEHEVKNDHSQKEMPSMDLKSSASFNEKPSQKLDHDGKQPITRTRSQRIRSEKYTLVTLSISIAFVLSFLPYLALVTWRTLAPHYEPSLMSNSEQVAFQIFIRSFLFNSGCNPVIYGLLNSEFKHMITSNLRRIFCCRNREPYALDNSNKST